MKATVPTDELLGELDANAIDAGLSFAVIAWDAAATIRALLAEVARLREALTEVASFPFGDGRSQARALAALAAQEDTE